MNVIKIVVSFVVEPNSVIVMFYILGLSSLQGRPQAARQDQVRDRLPEAPVRAGGGEAQGQGRAHAQGEGGKVQHVPREPLGALRAGQGLVDQVDLPLQWKRRTGKMSTPNSPPSSTVVNRSVS